MSIWVHNGIKEEVEYLHRRIEEQTEYTVDIKNCTFRSPETKAELIKASKFLQNQYRLQLGEYITQGLIALI